MSNMLRKGGNGSVTEASCCCCGWLVEEGQANWRKEREFKRGNRCKLLEFVFLFASNSI